MAVAYVSSNAHSGSDASETAISDTLTFPSITIASDELLLVLATRRVTFTGDILTGVTYGAAPLAELFQFNNYDSVNTECAIAGFFLFPSVDTDTSVVTFTGANNLRNAAYYVLSGVDQSTPFGTVFTKHVDGAFNTINNVGEGGTAGVVGGLMIDCVGLVGGSGGGATTQGTQTLRHMVNQGTSSHLFTSTAPGATTVNMGWSWTNNTAQRNYIVIPINPASGQVVRVRGGGLLLGVG